MVDRSVQLINLCKQNNLPEKFAYADQNKHAEFIGDGCNNINSNHVVLLLNVVLPVGLWFVSLYVHMKFHVQRLISEGLMTGSKYHV